LDIMDMGFHRLCKILKIYGLKDQTGFM